MFSLFTLLAGVRQIRSTPDTAQYGAKARCVRSLARSLVVTLVWFCFRNVMISLLNDVAIT